jgi:hypothetical protein
MIKDILALTTCFGFSDILDYTIPFNKEIFQNFIVVTSEIDNKTKKICEKHKIMFKEVPSNKLIKNRYNKGKFINTALRYYYSRFLDQKYWFLIMDSDIIINPNIEIINLNDLNKSSIYGCPRLNLEKDEANQFIENEILNFSLLEKARQKNFAASKTAIGYFQLFNKRNIYREQYDRIDITDSVFRKRFTTIKNLDNYFVVHIGKPYNWKKERKDKKNLPKPSIWDFDK